MESYGLFCTLFPYTTLFRSDPGERVRRVDHPRPEGELLHAEPLALVDEERRGPLVDLQHESGSRHRYPSLWSKATFLVPRSEEHTSELQSLAYIVCRLLLEK